jgi:hypothetical protein
LRQLAFGMDLLKKIALGFAHLADNEEFGMDWKNQITEPEAFLQLQLHLVDEKLPGPPLFSSKNQTFHPFDGDILMFLTKIQVDPVLTSDPGLKPQIRPLMDLLVRVRRGR